MVLATYLSVRTDVRLCLIKRAEEDRCGTYDA